MRGSASAIDETAKLSETYLWLGWAALESIFRTLFPSALHFQYITYLHHCAASFKLDMYT